MIKVKNVTKKYGKFYAVRNINFEVNDGEIVGFLGRNGAGKSTTMNMITGFIEPTDGEIIVNGYNIDQKPKKVKSQIGYMPEGTPLYSELTVKEFVSYMAELRGVPRKERKEAIKKAIADTGLEIVEDNLAKTLSRGYKQRLSMAGAIVGNPKILILDEPTVGLDPKQVIEIRELIKSFRKDHTVLLSSHILSEVSQICEKVIIIDKGEIVAVDTPENLESKTSETCNLSIIVDDMKDKFKSLKDTINEIVDITLEESLKDEQSSRYLVTTSITSISELQAIKKKLFSECAKQDIVILEMKNAENSLEDAFIKLIENRPEYSQKEIEKMQYNKEIDELRKEETAHKVEKENRKQAKKEEKARKKADKESKNEAKKESKKDNKEESKKDNNKDSKEEKSDKKDSEKKEGGDK